MILLLLLNPVLLALEEVRKPPKGNQARARRFAALLEEAGADKSSILQRRVIDAPGRQNNVIAVLPGTDPHAGSILLGAHTDSMGGGSGAIDNWSGCVMVCALYAKAKKKPLRHNLIVVGFAAEERGGLGSKQFVRRQKRLRAPAIKAMVNLECLGVGLPRIWVNHGADRLEELAKEAAEASKVTLKRQVLFGFMADAFAFEKAGIAAVTIHSLDPTGLKLINSKKDLPEEINLEHYAKTGKFLEAFIRRLDKTVTAIKPNDQERNYRPVSRRLLHSVKAGGAGLTVVQLPESAPESQAGLQAGDVLVRIGEVPIADHYVLTNTFLTLWRGSKVTMTVSRSVEGKSKELVLEVQY